ncbi:MAG: hypothetical protein R5N70_01740, partial [Cutibacterium granulosum]|nr:hypothetical protein [Cutibacterium granulosum]
DKDGARKTRRQPEVTRKNKERRPGGPAGTPNHESDRINGSPAAAPKPVIRKQAPAFAAATQRIIKPVRAKLGVTR